MGSERNAADKLKNAILGTKCFLAFDFFYKEEQPEVPHNQIKIPTFSQFFCTNLARPYRAVISGLATSRN